MNRNWSVWLLLGNIQIYIRKKIVQPTHTIVFQWHKFNFSGASSIPFLVQIGDKITCTLH